MPANTNRQSFFIKNDSAIAVTISFGTTPAVVGALGTILIPTNSYFENRDSRQINIIAASGTPNITAEER